MYKKVDANEIQKRPGWRKGESRFENTPEWRSMKTDLDKGLKANEAAQAILTPQDQDKYGITNRRTIFRFLKRYIEERGLKYEIKSFKKGEDFIFVVQLPAASSRRRTG